jgi:hypothetical protein
MLAFLLTGADSHHRLTGTYANLLLFVNILMYDVEMMHMTARPEAG